MQHDVLLLGCCRSPSAPSAPLQLLHLQLRGVFGTTASFSLLGLFVNTSEAMLGQRASRYILSGVQLVKVPAAGQGAQAGCQRRGAGATCRRPRGKEAGGPRRACGWLTPGRSNKQFYAQH